MNWIQVVIYSFQLVFRLWDAIAERNKERKRKKMEALKDAQKALIDRDASRLTAAFGRISRL